MKKLEYLKPVLEIFCFVEKDVLSSSKVRPEELGIDAGNSWWGA